MLEVVTMIMHLKMMAIIMTKMMAVVLMMGVITKVILSVIPVMMYACDQEWNYIQNLHRASELLFVV